MLAGCAIATASTIPVTGLGSFSLGGFHDTYANVCLNGEGVQVCANDVPIGPAPPEFLFGSSLRTVSMSYSTAIVDGVTGAYALSLGGDGEQYVQVMDPQGVILAKENISGAIQITSYQQFGERFINGQFNPEWRAQGTFTVGPAAQAQTQAIPEPGTLKLLGAGLLLIGFMWVLTR